MSAVNDLARFAGLIGDPARSNILTALISGKALTAGELSRGAGLTPQTVSAHLKQLEEGRIILRRKQGRHHYFAIANNEIAELLEKMMGIATNALGGAIKTGPKNEDMCRARICYDHLAGQMSVRLFDQLLAEKVISVKDDQVALTKAGTVFFDEFGLDMAAIEKAKRPTCRGCLDWSERRFHLAGGVGAAILRKIIADKWAYRLEDSRIIKFTPNGMRMMKQVFGVEA